MNARELYRTLKRLRRLRRWDKVWVQDVSDSSGYAWYPVGFIQMRDKGQVEIEDVLWLDPIRTKLVPVEDVRLSNPDHEVRIRPPVKIRLPRSSHGRHRGRHRG